MAISLANIKTAYVLFRTSRAAVATALQAITDLGPYPLLPLAITADADYNNVIAAQATWNTNYQTAYAAYQTALANQRAAEINTITVMQTGSGLTQGADEWFYLSNSSPKWDEWIAYSSKDRAADGDPYLVIETVQPTKPFVNAQ